MAKRRAWALLILGAAVPAALPAGCGDGPGGLSDAEKARRMAELYASYKDVFPEVPECGVAMIPGALDRDRFEGSLDTYRDVPVVVYCTIGYRSGKYAAELREQSLDARNLVGGILAWCHADGALVDAWAQPTRRVHVYGPRWDLLPEGYEGVW